MDEVIEEIVKQYFLGEDLKELLKRCNVTKEVLRRIFNDEV